MADVFTRKKRSEVMALIRSEGNKATELALINFFRRNKINGWRRRQPVLGKPDFVFKKLRLAVFVDGCFWHGCPIHGTTPGHNAGFWRNKFASNRRRDALVSRELSSIGWSVLRIWEHELVQKNNLQLLLRFTPHFKQASSF